ncbi:MAG: helix-turn-helix transcriptional regulator [Clostridiaceae bacterium]|nr:helix-turn-helix transcriptional regulator [Clostridiaceae bacterium]
MSRMGSEIARLRKEVGMTRKQLAKAIGVTEAFIVNVEAGKRIIKEDLIGKISKALRQEVGKLNLYDDEKDNKPEPDRNVVRVVEKPVQDVWNDALSGILMAVPVYNYKMEKLAETRQLPIVSNKVEGFPKDKVFYLQIEDNEMTGFRMSKGDYAFALSVQDIDTDGIYFIQYNGKRMVRQVKKLGGGKLLLVGNRGSLSTDTVYRKDANILARLIRLDITL